MRDAHQFEKLTRDGAKASILTAGWIGNVYHVVEQRYSEQLLYMYQQPGQNSRLQQNDAIGRSAQCPKWVPVQQ